MQNSINQSIKMGYITHIYDTFLDKNKVFFPKEITQIHQIYLWIEQDSEQAAWEKEWSWLIWLEFVRKDITKLVKVTFNIEEAHILEANFRYNSTNTKS